MSLGMWTGTKVVNKAELVGMWFRNNPNGSAKHAWQKLRTKRRRILFTVKFDIALLSEEGKSGLTCWAFGKIKSGRS